MNISEYQKKKKARSQSVVNACARVLSPSSNPVQTKIPCGGGDGGLCVRPTCCDGDVCRVCHEGSATDASSCGRGGGDVPSSATVSSCLVTASDGDGICGGDRCDDRGCVTGRSSLDDDDVVQGCHGGSGAQKRKWQQHHGRLTHGLCRRNTFGLCDVIE